MLFLPQPSPLSTSGCRQDAPSLLMATVGAAECTAKSTNVVIRYLVFDQAVCSNFHLVAFDLINSVKGQEQQSIFSLGGATYMDFDFHSLA